MDSAFRSMAVSDISTMSKLSAEIVKLFNSGITKSSELVS